MKKMIMVVVTLGMALCLVGCGKAKEDEVISQYQEEFGLNQEEAKELAELVSEINTSAESEEKEENVQEEMIAGVIAPCYKTALEHLKMIDLDYFGNHGETVILERYGKPTEVDREKNVWYYELDDGFTVAIRVESPSILYRVEDSSAKYNTKKDPEAPISNNFDLVKDCFDENGKYMYGLAEYKYYDDFVELLGNEGRIYSISKGAYTNSIEILWTFENDKYLRAVFDLVTGELISINLWSYITN